MKFEILSKDRARVKELLDEKFMPNFETMFGAVMKPAFGLVGSLTGFNFKYEQGYVEERGKVIYWNTLTYPSYMKILRLEKQFVKSLQEFFDKNNVTVIVKYGGD